MQIFVGNLAFTAPVDDVRQLFEPYGEIVRVHLPEDRETGRPRGFGFVEMPNNINWLRVLSSALTHCRRRIKRDFMRSAYVEGARRKHPAITHMSSLIPPQQSTHFSDHTACVCACDLSHG